MFSNKVSSKRSPLAPQKELRLVNVYLEQGRTARKEGEHEIALVLCDEAEASLSKMKKCVQAAGVKDVTDLRRGVACAFFQLSKLLEELQQHERAKESCSKAHDWGYTEVEMLSISTPPSLETSVSSATQLPYKVSVSIADQPSRKTSYATQPSLKATDATQLPLKTTGSTAAQPPFRPARTEGGKLALIVNVDERAESGEPSVITDKILPTVPSTDQLYAAIFPRNLGKPVIKTALPKIGEPIDTTVQLVFCLTLLAKGTPSSPSDTGTPTVSFALSEDEQAWIRVIEQEPVEQYHIYWLTTRLVEEFIKDNLKSFFSVTEVVYVSPMLDREHFRKLLCCVIAEFETAILLDVGLLQGLVQLVRSARPGYLLEGDLIKILAILQARLQVTHQQSTEHPYHLTLAVSHVLDVMARQEVRDVNRLELHEPLAAILSTLRGSSDPFLMYQASYAFQALQCIPDDEAVLQAVMRHSRVVAEGLINISGVVNLNLSRFLDGLGQFQKAIIETIGTAKNTYEGVRSLIEGGQGIFEAIKDGVCAGNKRAWYPALIAAATLVREGRLADFKTLVVEAACRQSHEFQWGICQLLGEIALDPIWDLANRQQAVDFLVELYTSDLDWNKDASVRNWMLTILRLVSDSTAQTIIAPSAFLQQCVDRAEFATSYPLTSSLPLPMDSPLLARAQEIPYIEYELHRLKVRRLRGQDQAVYIPPQAQVNRDAPDNELFPLMEKVKEFLTSDRRVLLLLGVAGAGKSTFSRTLECEIWKSYKMNGEIPLHINLPEIRRPEHDLITKHLRSNDFTDAQIREVKRHRQLLLICDGYDESQQSHNLYNSNQLNLDGSAYWKARMVITCRSEYLGQDYRDRFQPTNLGHSPISGQFQELLISPFSISQIHAYIELYVSLTKPLWPVETYKEALSKVPSLMDMIKNPFLLSLSLEVLPRVADDDQIQDLSDVTITRDALYGQFIEYWLEHGKKRVGARDLSPQAKAAFNSLVDEGFTQSGIYFLKRLAAAIYREQEGQPVVEYSHFRDQGTWKADFFGREDECQILREASPLARHGNRFRFLHRSLLEYCFVLAVFDPQDNRNLRPSQAALRRGSFGSIHSFDDVPSAARDCTGNSQIPSDHPLSCKCLSGEPSVMQVLVDRVHQAAPFKQQLKRLIERSKAEKEWRKAAANAITILVRAGVRFNGADLRGVQIPRADLRGGEFDSTQLQGADLRKTKLQHIWLRNADLSDAQMAGVDFEELPYIVQRSGVQCCAYSPDGTVCAVGLCSNEIKLHNTSTWKELCTLQGHEDKVAIVVYSPDGTQIASGSDDRTVRLWDSRRNKAITVFHGHTSRVVCVVYSPEGSLIASCSSDKTVRLWDSTTLLPDCILRGHTNIVMSVVFSPSGEYVASGGYDNTVRIWSAHNGSPIHILSQHTSCVKSVVYSPDGKHIASASYDKTVRIWDSKSGDSLLQLPHENMVTSVAYSPTGLQIAAGSGNQVHLWDPKTATKLHVLSGHTDAITSVVYSPNEHQIASISHDKTARLWDTQSGAPGRTNIGHVNNIMSIVYAPNGQQIATASLDKTVRIWNSKTDASVQRSSGHTDRVNSVTYSPWGLTLASGGFDKTVRLWNAKTGELIKILGDHVHQTVSDDVNQAASENVNRAVGGTVNQIVSGSVNQAVSDKVGRIERVVYSPTGDHIALGSDDSFVYIWNAETGEVVHKLIGHEDRVTSVAYSPDGKEVASGSDDWTVYLWDTELGTERHRLVEHSAGVTDVAYSPNGKQIASGSFDKTIILWHADSGEFIKKLVGHTGIVTSVVYSPNGKWIASGSNDKTVRVWEALTGHFTELKGHTDRVRSVVFSPSSQAIASSSLDNSVKLWEVGSGQLLITVEATSIRSLAWVRNDYDRYDLYGYDTESFLATGGDDKSVRVWSVRWTESLPTVQLHWSSTHDRLVVSGAKLSKKNGLSDNNKKLMEQLGAKERKTQATKLRMTAERVVSINTAVAQMQKAGIRRELDVPYIVDTLPDPPSESMEFS